MSDAELVHERKPRFGIVERPVVRHAGAVDADRHIAVRAGGDVRGLGPRLQFRDQSTRQEVGVHVDHGLGSIVWIRLAV